MKIKVVLEPSDEGGYTVYAPSLPGCISEGDTKEEALANIKEAIELYMEPVEDDFTVSPDTEIMEIAVGPKYPVWVMKKLLKPLKEMDGLLFARRAATFVSINI
jgi:predicted RNase H-like HicB family nuclease